MRLKPEKVEDLSRQITEALKADKRVGVIGSPEDVERAIRAVILADLRSEDELMEEVERVIESHRDKIAGKNVDMQVLRRKSRDQLVRDKKMIL